MDFHSLPRKDLQALCKKNKIPANLTNVAMADALQSLKSIEWEEDIKQRLMPQSATVEQQHGSPLPRSRRVVASSNDTSGFSMEGTPDKEDEMKKEALIEANQTPSTAVRRSQRIQSSMSTRTRARTSTSVTGTATRTSTATTGSVIRTSATPVGRFTSAAGTRTRRAQKEEAPTEAVEVMTESTPAPQRGRKKAVEMPAQVVPTPATHRGQKKATNAQVPVARSSARPTRQSTRRLTEVTEGSRVTRTMANMMSLDLDDDKEAQAASEKVEEKEEQTAVELKDVPEISEILPELNLDTEEKKIMVSDAAPEEEREAMTALDVIELGEATEPDSADKLEVEEQTDQNGEVSEERELAKEDFILGKEDELVSDESLNLMEHNTEQIESTEENNEVFPTKKAEDTVEEKPSSNVSFRFDSEIPTEKVEEAVEEKQSSNEFGFDSEIPTEKVEGAEENLNSEDKDDVSVEQPVEEVNVVESASNVAQISDEVQVMEESEIKQAIQADSPITGLVSDVGPENNSDIQEDPLYDITVDPQVVPSDLCFLSPVKAPTDIVMEKMLDSVVRHLAKASIKDSAKKTDTCCVVQKEETVKIVSDDAPGLAQNENAVTEKVDLESMSLRKLKALYKDHLIEVNSKKAAEEGKRLPLGKLDENLLV